MSLRKFLLIIIFGLVFLPLWAEEQREQEITALLMANAEQAIKFKRVITFLMKINMGIPGGENWLVEWHDKNDNISRNIYVYSINGSEISKSFLLTLNFHPEVITDFNIMRDIPGIQVGTGTCAVYDYNGDGLDEIFNFGIYGMGYFINISGYDTENDTDTYYNDDIPFGILDPEKGPAPARFLTYKGKKGFIVYHVRNSVDRDPLDPKNHSWRFYAWNESTRKYEEVEEFDPAAATGSFFDEPEAEVIINSEPAVSAEEAVAQAEPAPPEQMPPPEQENSTRYGKLIFLPAVIIILAIIAAGIIIIRRKKKNR